MRIHRARCGDACFSSCDAAKFLGYRTCAVADHWSRRYYPQRFFQKSGVLTDRSCFIRLAIFLRLDDGFRNTVAQYRRGKPHCAPPHDCKQYGKQNSLPSKQAPTEQQKQERRDRKRAPAGGRKCEINQEQRAYRKDQDPPTPAPLLGGASTALGVRWAGCRRRRERPWQPDG